MAHYWQMFRDGAMAKGVSEESAWRIFDKFNCGYMFHLPLIGYLSIPLLILPVAAVLLFSTLDL